MVGNFDKPQTSFFYIGLIGFVIMTLSAPFFWVQMAGQHIWLLCLLCITSVIGHFLTIKALALAPLSVIQPFNYLQLVWSVIMGYLVLREIPDMFTLLGATLIVGSGLFVFYREQKRAAHIKK